MKERRYTASAEEKKAIRQRLLERLEQVEQISFAYLYGSFVDEDNLPFHDIDLGIHLVEMPAAQSGGLALRLAVELTLLTTIPVDVRVLNRAPVTFLYHVLRGELLLERDEDLRSTIAEDTVRIYLDMEPLLRRAIKDAYSG